jgi:anthranilate/para-aminobenzoate synthase component II
LPRGQGGRLTAAASRRYNAHSKGIGPKDFAANAGLAANLTVLATGADRNGREFVAQVEAKSLPIYANQFHPEKIEWVHSPQVRRPA